MRKALCGMCMCLLLLFSFPTYAARVETVMGEAQITSKVLNVRSGPSTEHEIRGTLTKGQIVEVVGFEEPDWYVIDYGGQPGYINGKYLIYTEILQENPPNEPEEETASRPYLIPILGIAILVVLVLMAVTLIALRRKEEEEEEEDEEDEIPVTDHDDTNMHLGEISYDTYRLDIDPSFFENTSEIQQPERISSEERSRMLDDKLEQASLRLAQLQKEVEELKSIKQNDEI